VELLFLLVSNLSNGRKQITATIHSIIANHKSIKKIRQFSRLETELDVLMQNDLSNEKDKVVTLQREVDDKVGR